jgi:hypothetical protein
MDDTLARLFSDLARNVPAFDFGKAVEEANALYPDPEVSWKQLEDELYFAIRDSHRNQSRAQLARGNTAAHYNVMAHMFRVEAQNIAKQLNALDGYVMPAYLKALYESLGT